MATFVLIHGAAGSAWYWHLVEPELRQRGHDVVSMDLPVGDDSAGLAEYVETVLEAIGDSTELVVVAQSFAGFTGPLLCERVDVDLLVMLNAMVPSPGERPADWWENTGFEEAMSSAAEREGYSTDDPLSVFFHDVPPDVAAEALAAGEPVQSGTPLEKPWPPRRCAQPSHGAGRAIGLLCGRAGGVGRLREWRLRPMSFSS